jgi:coenzyme PQQ precursor peptide PqqA
LHEKSTFAPLRATSKRLISRAFGSGPPHKSVNCFAMQHEPGAVSNKKISLANFSIHSTLPPRAKSVRYQKESLMAWKAPKIVEVPVGMEINMYACAARK